MMAHVFFLLIKVTPLDPLVGGKVMEKYWRQGNGKIFELSNTYFPENDVLGCAYYIYCKKITSIP